MVVAVVVVMVMVVLMIVVVVVMMMTVLVMTFFQMSVQIHHVMVVTVVFLVEDHIKVTAINACFLDPADPDLKSVSGNPVEHSKELARIRSQIQKRRDRHIAADPGPTF
jgi:hypothetical protein